MASCCLRTKENHFDELRERFPADRHVLIDDKRRILTTAKHRLGDAARTVFVRQGTYALAEAYRYPPAVDRLIGRRTSTPELRISRLSCQLSSGRYFPPPATADCRGWLPAVPIGVQPLLDADRTVKPGAGAVSEGRPTIGLTPHNKLPALLCTPSPFTTLCISSIRQSPAMAGIRP
jgi:hypothetical protein